MMQMQLLNENGKSSKRRIENGNSSSDGRRNKQG